MVVMSKIVDSVNVWFFFCVMWLGVFGGSVYGVVLDGLF